MARWNCQPQRVWARACGPSIDLCPATADEAEGQPWLDFACVYPGAIVCACERPCSGIQPDPSLLRRPSACPRRVRCAWFRSSPATRAPRSAKSVARIVAAPNGPAVRPVGKTAKSSALRNGDLSSVSDHAVRARAAPGGSGWRKAPGLWPRCARGRGPRGRAARATGAAPAPRARAATRRRTRWRCARRWAIRSRCAANHPEAPTGVAAKSAAPIGSRAR